MKLINFQADNNGLYISIPVEKRLPIPGFEDYTHDYLDFNTVTIDDFRDYFEMSDYEKYCFIIVDGTGKRLQEIIDTYLPEFKNIISVVPISDVTDNYPTNHKLTQYISEIKNIEPSYKDAIVNGYIALNTGIYPEYLGKGLLKHVYIENPSLIQSIRDNILPYMAINSSIIQNEFNTSIPGFLTLNSSNFTNIEKKFINIDNLEIEQYMKEFINSGQINEHLHSSYIIDYSSSVGTNKMNALFVTDEGISFTSQTTSLPLINIDEPYFNILNSFSTLHTNNINSSFSKDFLKLFPMLIEFKLNMKISHFNTPYNKWNYEAMKSAPMPKWIGFKSNEIYYAFNLQKNKLFKIEEYFYTELEKIIKGIVENTKLQKEIRSILDGV